MIFHVVVNVIIKNHLLLTAYSTRKSTQPIKSLNSFIPENSILKLFCYNRLTMPKHTTLVYDSLVFLLVDNTKETLDQAIKYFSEKFLLGMKINFHKARESNESLENIVNIVICKSTGSNKLCFSKNLSNFIIYKILETNKENLNKKFPGYFVENFLIKNTLNLPYHLGNLTRFNLKLSFNFFSENHLKMHEKFIVDNVQENFELKKKLPKKPV